jgi:hypothetical protein
LAQVCGDAARLAAAAFIEDRNPRLEAGAVLGRAVASVDRPSTLAWAEKGGFIRTTLGLEEASR